MNKKFLQRSFISDFIRSIAIISVILTHTMVLPEKVLLSGIFNVVYLTLLRTCVPFFIIISGSFLIEKQESNISLVKRIVKIVVPWISWTILTTIFFILVNNIRVHSVFQIIRLLKVNFLYFWFMSVILGLYILLPLLRIYERYEKRALLYLFFVWLVCISLIPSILLRDRLLDVYNNPSIIWLAILFLGYFLYGYLYKTITNKKLLIKVSIILTVIGLLWTIIGIYSWAFTLKVWNIRYINYITTNIVVFSLGSYVLLYNFVEKFDNRVPINIKNLFRSISILSLPIYLSHEIILWYIIKLFKLPSYISRSIFEQIFIGFLVFILTYVTVLIIKRIPVLKTLLAN